MKYFMTMTKFDDSLIECTEKQRRFVLAYVSEAHGNGVEAARIAEYAYPRVDACRLLDSANVRKAVAAFYEMYVCDAKQWVATTAERSQGLPDSCYDSAGKPDLLAIKKQGYTYMIKRVSYTRTGDPVVELHDPAKYHEMLGKHLGTLRDQVDMTNTGEVSITFLDNLRNTSNNALQSTENEARQLEVINDLQPKLLSDSALQESVPERLGD